MDDQQVWCTVDQSVTCPTDQSRKHVYKYSIYVSESEQSIFTFDYCTFLICFPFHCKETYTCKTRFQRQSQEKNNQLIEQRRAETYGTRVVFGVGLEWICVDTDKQYRLGIAGN